MVTMDKRLEGTKREAGKLGRNHIDMYSKTGNRKKNRFERDCRNHLQDFRMG